MLIRFVTAIKNKQFAKELQNTFSSASDIQLKILGQTKKSWQTLLRSCGDIFLINASSIPTPLESQIGVLSSLPEKPITIILHDSDSPEDHAQLVAAGADTVLHSDISPTSLIEALEAIIESRRQFISLNRFDRVGRLKPAISDFVSNSEEMQIFMDEVRQVVASNATLLILGETGVGKEHLAKAIHAESPRSNGPFITVNTAALPEQLLESELFGHEQGAFTGAVRSRRGAFEQAHKGTIFLDEIGDMPLHLQTKLLRALQDCEIVPIGSEETIMVDVRIIAATNRNLEDDINNGTFRRDLYYRLSVVALTIPPLRERKEDIPTLIDIFIKYFRSKIGRDVSEISESAVDMMSRYHWPGNVRELMNVIERAMLLCRSDCITPQNLPASISMPDTLQSGFPLTDLLDSSTWTGKSLPEVRKEVLQNVDFLYLDTLLRHVKGRIGKAAQIAGIHQRGLYARMKELGLTKETYKG